MRSRSVLWALGGLFLSACRGPIPTNDVLWSSPPEKLQSSRPVDIAVLPPRDATGRVGMLPGLTPAALPLPEIRRIAYKELVRRRYSPLSLDFVDRAYLGKPGPTEASYGEIRERCGADALLGIRVTRWDASGIAADRVFSIGAEAYLVDTKTGETIWQGKSDWDVNLDKEPDLDRVTSPELQERAIARFFSRLFSQLPLRETPEGPWGN